MTPVKSRATANALIKNITTGGKGELRANAPPVSTGGVPWRGIRQCQLTLQVLMPKGMYAGHQPIRPVTSGTRPT
jgi:hypothetical protein